MVDADTPEMKLFGDPIDDTESLETQDDPNLHPDPDAPDPDKDEDPEKKRFEYWQSIADRERNRANELEFAAPVARLLKEKPEILLKLQAELVNSGKQEDAGPKRPEMPARPADYDEVAAYSNPDSSSFQYRKAVEAHREAMINYIEERDKAREVLLHKELQRRETEEQERIRLAKLKTILVQKGLTPVESEDFIQTMNSPESFTADNLIALYKLRKSAKAKPDKARDMEDRSKRRDVPLPDASGGVTRKTEEVDKDKAMSGAFLKAAKSK